MACQPHKHTYIATVSLDLDSAPQTDKQGNDGETSQITLNSVVLSLHIHIFSLSSLWLDLERMKSRHLSANKHFTYLLNKWLSTLSLEYALKSSGNSITGIVT